MKNIEVATIGGGCFWCVEAVMQRLNGVISVESGYAGGETPNPTYREISSGTTGHAEVVQVNFDSDVINYEDILTVFMTSHDPTTLNRQGADRGTQYRSIIMYHNDEQNAIAKKVLESMSSYYNNPIVTELKPQDIYYKGEQYHQDYYNRNSYVGYCNVVIAPKLAKLRALYADKLKPEYAGQEMNSKL